MKLYQNKEWLENKFRELKYAQTIGKEIAVSGDVIEYWRKKFNIPKLNDNQGHRKYFYNQDYFKVIDSEEKAYWLGFIMADGAITKNCKNGIDNRLSIILKLSDIEHLKKFQKSIESNQKIITKTVTSKGHSSEICELRFNSKIICDDLMRFGVTSNKTGKELIPSLSEELVHHFIRGFFDGDGCIYRNGKYLNASVCSASITFINQLKDVLNKLTIKPYIEDRCKNGKSFYVIGTKKQLYVKIFLDYMYKDSTIYLERKYEKYINFYSSPVQ